MRIDRSAQARIVDRGAGRFTIEGEVVFGTVMSLLVESRAQFAEQQSIEVDLQGVTRINTAGLALVVEWLRWARQERRNLTLVNPPPTLTALARICEADNIIASALANAAGA